MEASLYLKMLADESVTNLKKMQHKYGREIVAEWLALLQKSTYTQLPLLDFYGVFCVYQKHMIQTKFSPARALLLPQKDGYGRAAMEQEVYSTLAIERIDSSWESIRKIFKGYAPNGQAEECIYSLKKGLEFICNPENSITEENLYRLYQIAIADFLEKENQLLPGQYYRHDAVYIVGTEIEHIGLPHTRLSVYMKGLIAFIQREDGMDDLQKAAAIHFYFSYVHPYFDGNGRMARLLHQWYLVQRGYSSALFVSFSYHIHRTKKKYYHAYKQVEENAKISGVLDVTPFLLYFAEEIYQYVRTETKENLVERFHAMLQEGRVTEKELWNFVLSAYGEKEFSTKQLERDFANAAYATIRSFVRKFTEMELLDSISYGNRRKYKING